MTFAANAKGKSELFTIWLIFPPFFHQQCRNNVKKIGYRKFKHIQLSVQIAERRQKIVYFFFNRCSCNNLRCKHSSKTRIRLSMF